MNARLLEQLQIVPGFSPVDMQTGANPGDYVNLAQYKRVLIVLFKAAGVAGDDPILALEQAKNVAGLEVKALTFTEIYKKQGTLASIGQWTKVTQAAAASYTDAVSAEAAAVWAVEVDADMLDIQGGFCCVAANIADVGAGGAQLGCLFYILGEPRFPQQPSGMPSAIV